MRIGRPLGTLSIIVDKIYCAISAEGPNPNDPEDAKYLKDIENGKFIKRKQ